MRRTQISKLIEGFYKRNMFYLKLVILCFLINFVKTQQGPDPWNYDSSDLLYNKDIEHDVPPDIRMALKKTINSENKGTTGICEWSYKRMVAIMIKAGQVQEDGNVIVSLQLKFDSGHWQMLNEYVKSGTPSSEDIFRRTLGYVENAIYKPNISEKISMAWTGYVHTYISEYKMHITWTFATLAASLLVIWLWKHMSHRHILIILFVMLYFYEIFISYKEAEEQEYQKFINALNSCKWYFWTTSCDIPPPDIVTFLKHMSPSKIGIRMFATLVSEPMITMSAVIKPIIHDITDGLWWPFDKIAYALITVSINVFIIVIFIFIICNFIFNIPINLSFGLFNMGLKQRRRTLFSSNDTNESRNNQFQRINDNGSISNSTLDKILDVCSQALAVQNNIVVQRNHLNAVTGINNVNTFKPQVIRRSSSTGRLPSSSTFDNHNQVVLNNNIKQRNNFAFDKGGGGDAAA